MLKFASFSSRPKPTSMQKTQSTISIPHNTFIARVAAIHPALHAKLQSLLLQWRDSSHSGFSWGSRERLANKSLPASCCVQSWPRRKKPLVWSPPHTSSWKAHVTTFYIEHLSLVVLQRVVGPPRSFYCRSCRSLPVSRFVQSRRGCERLHVPIHISFLFLDICMLHGNVSISKRCNSRRVLGNKLPYILLLLMAHFKLVSFLSRQTPTLIRATNCTTTHCLSRPRFFLKINWFVRLFRIQRFIHRCSSVRRLLFIWLLNAVTSKCANFSSRAMLTLKPGACTQSLKWQWLFCIWLARLILCLQPWLYPPQKSDRK
jgi:hypothetical protein